jgi:hypothetical protein
MTFDFEKILESKRALRRKLAGLPVAEKLAMLDELRERAVALRKAAGPLRQPVVRETPAPYKSGPGGEKGSKK